MPSCEKCWEDAFGNPEKYRELIEERKNDPCTPEEQAGEDATECPKCKRKTVHQYAKICMVCGNKELPLTYLCMISSRLINRKF